MSWMDDGGFEIKTFATKQGDDGANELPHLGRQLRRHPEQDRRATHQTRMQSNPQGIRQDEGDEMRRKETNRRLVYRARRVKTSIASIAFVVSCTLLFVAERPASAPGLWVVTAVYLLTGLWLIVRFAPRD